jgi:hypothetical protein
LQNNKQGSNNDAQRSKYMQPSITPEGVECVYLHRREAETEEMEINQLVVSLELLLSSRPKIEREYLTWRGHNDARVAANMEPEPAPDTLYHYDIAHRLKERASELRDSPSAENHDTVVVTQSEADSIDRLIHESEGRAGLQAVGFLFKICEYFDTEEEQSEQQ